MSKRDYYEVLGVSKSSDSIALKKAYRKLAMKYHPDRNPGDKQAEENFKEAKEAYEVLADSNKRAAYDQFGHAGVSQGAGGAGSASGGFGDIFEDIFGDIFGGAGGGQRSAGQGARSRAQRGSDLRYTLDLTLAEAVQGKEIKITVPTYVRCEGCSGSGAKKGSGQTNCSTCGGAGQVRMQQGFFSVTQTCPSCQGAGQVIKEPCLTCNGQGRKKGNRKLSVKIPAGVDGEDRIRLSEEGEAGIYGGPPGDLYVQIKLKPHEIFKRDGLDLHCEVPVSYTKAVLGGELEVPTLDGRVKLKIPAETQTNKLFRMRNKGIKAIRGSQRGDLICRITIETPVNLTTEQQELLEKFDETLSADKNHYNPKATRWFSGVKKFFDEMKF